MKDRVVTTGTHEQSDAFADGRPGISVSYWLTLPGRHDFAREVALFEAAPALLAACELVLERQRNAANSGWVLHADSVEALRAALALARGE